MQQMPRVCIIGAGCSGMTAAKALKDQGIPFDWFERSERIGGLWTGDKVRVGSAAYRGLHINSSKARTEFADFPMPDHYPDYPHQTLMAAYFDAYADHFGLRRLCTFNTEVAAAAHRADGLWDIELNTGERRLYDGLVVANGHHWNPRYPEPPFPGAFQGRVMHAHDYVDAEPFRGKRVLVLGIGNSAADIAVESSFVAAKTYLSMRRGAHVIPKYLFGRPLDQFNLPTWVPFRVRRFFQEQALRIAMGRVERYGIPKPDHRLLDAHPTVSPYLLQRIADGAIHVRPNIAELMGDEVRFADGTADEVDVIVYCTGYKITFPFFDEEFLSAPDNEMPLFHRVFKPGLPSVAFIGLLQPLGAVMPLAEAQSKWVAAYFAGQYALPADGEMEAATAADRRAMAARYVTSKRHTIQVDFDDYLAGLRRERERGARRAQAMGHRLPARAASDAAAAKE